MADKATASQSVFCVFAVGVCQSRHFLFLTSSLDSLNTSDSNIHIVPGATYFPFIYFSILLDAALDISAVTPL